MKIVAFARESGLPFTALLAQRNIVTEGIDLNALVGKDFRFGSVRIRGIRFCEPCVRLAARVGLRQLMDMSSDGQVEGQDFFTLGS